MIKIYLSVHGQHFATFKTDGLRQLAQLLVPMLTDSKALQGGFMNERGFRVAIGETQKQSRQQMLTIVSPQQSLKWPDGVPFDGSYFRVQRSLSRAIDQAMNTYNNGAGTSELSITRKAYRAI